MENKFPLLYSQIGNILAGYPQVVAVYIFGSQITGNTVAKSDVDVAVVLDPKSSLKYEPLYSAISQLLPDHELDLRIVNENSKIVFLFQLIQTGKRIYERTPDDRMAFEIKVMRDYYDSQHMRDIYNSYLLKSLKTYAHQ